MRAFAFDRILRGVLLLVLLGTACGAPGGAATVTQDNGSPDSPAATGGRQYDFHSDRAELNTPSAMCRALYVAVATVRGFGASHWNTSGGTAPSGDIDKAVRQLGYLIYTSILTADTKALVDHRTSTTAGLVAHGGRVGSIGIRDDAYPVLRTGASYVLVFVPTIQGGADRIDPTVLVAHNAFPISGDRALLQPRIVEQGRVTQQEVTVSLAELGTQLSRC